jgi:hypothetical protein
MLRLKKPKETLIGKASVTISTLYILSLLFSFKRNVREAV